MLFNIFTQQQNKLLNSQILKESFRLGMDLTAFSRTRSPRVIAAVGMVLGLLQPMAISQTPESATLSNQADANYQDPNVPTTTINTTSNTVQTGASFVTTVDLDFGITLTQVTEDLTPGEQGVFDIAVVNNGPGTIDRFLIANDFALILEDISLSALTFVDENGNVIATPNLTLEIQDDGSFLILGLDMEPGRTISLRVTGNIKAIADDVEQFAAQVTVQSPVTDSGIPYFNDINPDNDTDFLIDPLGRVVNCDGQLFEDYTGVSRNLCKQGN